MEARRAAPWSQDGQRRGCEPVRRGRAGAHERGWRLSPRRDSSVSRTAKAPARPHAPGRPSVARPRAREGSLARFRRSSTPTLPCVLECGWPSARPRHAPAERRPARSTRCIEDQGPRRSPSAPWRYASPRSASMSAAAVPAGSRMAGQPSVGSPASTGGRITPDETSSSKRPGVPLAPAPGGTSSATTRPWAVIATRSPASVRRM